MRCGRPGSAIQTATSTDAINSRTGAARSVAPRSGPRGNAWGRPTRSCLAKERGPENVERVKGPHTHPRAVRPRARPSHRERGPVGSAGSPGGGARRRFTRCPGAQFSSRMLSREKENTELPRRAERPRRPGTEPPRPDEKQLPSWVEVKSSTGGRQAGFD